jgi:hypothetical protein
VRVRLAVGEALGGEVAVLAPECMPVGSEGPSRSASPSCQRRCAMARRLSSNALAEGAKRAPGAEGGSGGNTLDQARSLTESSPPT